ncbi:MAG: cupin domain-containing protein, partial [Hyphomonadaceae bacterium]
LTLVLHGRYEDESGAYAPGDIAFADETADHRPHVPRGEDCVCLIARSGDMQFRGLLGFLVSIWPASPETKSQA